MSVAKNKELVRSFYEAGNRGDLDACVAILADDITWTNIGSTRFSGTFHGKANLMENIIGPLFGQLESGIQSTVHELIGEGDVVVALTSGRATTLDGQSYNNTYCHVIRIRDGQFSEVAEYFDTALAAAILRLSLIHI